MRRCDWKTSINVYVHGKLIIEQGQEAVRLWIMRKRNGRLLVNIKFVFIFNHVIGYRVHRADEYRRTVWKWKISTGAGLCNVIAKNEQRLGPCEPNDFCRRSSFVRLNNGLFSLSKVTHGRSDRSTPVALIDGNVIDRRASSVPVARIAAISERPHTRGPECSERDESPRKSPFRGRYHWQQRCVIATEFCRTYPQNRRPVCRSSATRYDHHKEGGGGWLSSTDTACTTAHGRGRNNEEIVNVPRKTESVLIGFVWRFNIFMFFTRLPFAVVGRRRSPNTSVPNKRRTFDHVTGFRFIERQQGEYKTQHFNRQFRTMYIFF